MFEPFCDKPSLAGDRRDGFLGNEEHGWERGDACGGRRADPRLLAGNTLARKLRRRDISHLSTLTGLVGSPSATRLSPLGRDDRCDDGAAVTAVSGDILPIAPSGEFVDEKLTVP